MNKVELIGYLSKDPDLTQTASGIALCKFSIAVNRSYKDENRKSIVDFLNCIAWRELANTIHSYCSRGDRIGVVGAIETRTYEDKQGNKRTATDIVVSEIEFLTSKYKDNVKEQAQSKEVESKQQLLIANYEDEDVPF